MAKQTPRRITLDVLPATPERWPDVELLFGRNGACAGCWCMYWLRTASAYMKGKGEGNRRALRSLVRSDRQPGLIGYHDGRPVAWCAVAPREAYVRLEHSRVLAPLDDKPVWSVPCFFVSRPFRRKGLSVQMLKAAGRFAARNGATILEGYPQVPRTPNVPDAFAWCGLANAFTAAGFEEAARRSPTRPVMRKKLRKPRSTAPGRKLKG